VQNCPLADNLDSMKYVPLGETKAINKKELTQKALCYLERNEWGRGWTRGAAASWQSEILEITPAKLVTEGLDGRVMSNEPVSPVERQIKRWRMVLNYVYCLWDPSWQLPMVQRSAGWQRYTSSLTAGC